jgi:hypothetical protein
MSQKNYTAFHVDIHGIAVARYDLIAQDDEAAKSEARNYLNLHPSIEVWQGPRWVARLGREEPGSIRGH